MEDSISIADGAILTGVSEETLLEYSSKGFLKATEVEGELRFCAEELRLLFGSSTVKQTKSQEERVDSSDSERLSEQIEILHVDSQVLDNSEHKLIQLQSENQRLLDENSHLKEERAWLRQRLEKLETRSERDQMLMLSELETIRGLARAGSKSGGLLSRLPWFGKSSKGS